MKKSNCTKWFFCHLKPNKSLGPLILLTSYLAIDQPGPVWSGPGSTLGVLGPVGEAAAGPQSSNANSVKRSAQKRELGRIYSKEAEGAGCVSQANSWVPHFNVFQRTPFWVGHWGHGWRKHWGMHLRLMMRIQRHNFNSFWPLIRRCAKFWPEHPQHFLAEGHEQHGGVY